MAPSSTTTATRLKSTYLYGRQTTICKITPLRLSQHSTDESTLSRGANLAGFERSGTDCAGSEEQAPGERKNEPRRWGRSSCGGSSRPSSTGGRQPKSSYSPRIRSRRIRPRAGSACGALPQLVAAGAAQRRSAWRTAVAAVARPPWAAAAGTV